MDYISRTLAKGLDVLLLLADKDGLSLAEISNKTGISKTTAFRLLYTLCEYELICKSDNKYYMNCAYNLLQPDNKILDWSVIPYIKPLVEEFNLSAYIGIPTGEIHHLLSNNSEKRPPGGLRYSWREAAFKYQRNG